jgi:hypothetical protein
MSNSEPVPTNVEEFVAHMMPKPDRSYRERGIEMLVAAGLSPESAKSGWDFMKDIQRVIFTGIMFGIISYFFFGGAYLKMFGLYSIYDIELLYSLLYELIFLAPADLPINELVFSLEVCLTYFVVGLIHILTAITLDISGWFIRQLIRIPWKVFQLLFNVLWYLHCRLSDRIVEAPWTYGFLFGCLFLIAEPKDYLKGIGILVSWSLRTLLSIVIVAISATVSFLPTVWSACSMALERSREPFLKTRQILEPFLVRIYNQGTSIWNGFWTIFWLMLEPLIVVVKRVAVICFQSHADELYTYTPLQAGREIRLLRLNGSITGPLIKGSWFTCQLASYQLTNASRMFGVTRLEEKQSF